MAQPRPRGDVVVGPGREPFAEFAREAERRLRIALTPGYGAERTADATTDALVHAWRHWHRVREMENPFGYLYRIAARRAARRPRKQPRPSPLQPVESPHVEPGLERALSGLSRRQRIVTVLVEAYDWRQSEVADLLGISPSSVKRHLDRGLAKLRTALGVTDV